MVDAPLDMRMDRKSEFSAENVVNEYSESELKRILYEYGEEDFAPLIARNIVKEREKKRITTTGELVEILDRCIPKFKRKQGHVAKKTFQALRIEVNGELDGLEEVIYQMVRSLKKGGRIAIITFHSLEDRIVKRVFKDLETDCICDKSLPVCVCGKVKEIELVNKKPIVASALELEQNREKALKLLFKHEEEKVDEFVDSNEDFSNVQIITEDLDVAVPTSSVATKSQENTTTSYKMTSKTKVMICLYALVVTILLAVIINNSAMLSKMTSSTNSRETRLNTLYAEKMELDEILNEVSSDETVIERATEILGMVESTNGESILVEVPELIQNPEIKEDTNWFDKLCDTLSGIFN